MFFQILGAIAEFEHALMSERTRHGLDAARVWRLRHGLAMMLRMAYDEDLANRIRELIARDPDVTEMRMFGGVGLPRRGQHVGRSQPPGWRDGAR